MDLSLKKITKALAVVAAGLAATASFAQSQSQLGRPGAMPEGANFMENKGQWDDRALFYGSRPGLGYWVTRTGLKLDVHRYVQADQPKSGLDQPGVGDVDLNRTTERRGHVLSLDFVGAEGSATPKGTSAAPTKTDFFLGRAENHRRGVKSFAEAYAQNVLPGVHLRSYLQEGDSRFDIVVMPGTDAKSVKYQIKGAKGLRLENSRVLAIDTAEGVLKTADLFAYQMVGNRVIPVPARFNLQGTVVGFDLGSYDPRLPLIIDPLVYGSYVGSDAVQGAGNGAETLNSVYADSTGSVYMVGFTNSGTFPVTDGPYSINLSGGNDMFLARMRGDAYTWEYAAFIGGSGNDVAARVDVSESNGKLWIAGITTSPNFPGANNAAVNGAVVVRFSIAANRDLSPDFSTHLGNISVADFNVDSQGRPVMAGTATNAFLVGDGYVPFIAGAGGGNDGYVLRLNQDGTTNAKVIVGSTVSDFLTGLDVSATDDVAVSFSIANTGNQDTSTAAAPIFPTTAGVYANGRLLRNQDIGVVKLDENLAPIFSATLGGAANEASRGVAFDPLGDVYVLGNTSSFDYPTSSGAFREEVNGDFVVTKISGLGDQIKYSTGIGRAETVTANRIRVDSRGVAYVGGTVGWRFGAVPGQTIQGSIPTTPDAVDPNYVGGVEQINVPRADADFDPTTEAFFMAFNPAGTQQLYSTYIGSNGNEALTDLFVDSVGAVWISGNTQAVFNNLGVRKEEFGAQVGNRFQGHVTPNAFKFAPGFGDQDGFVVKYRINLPVLNAISLAPNNVAGGLGASTSATVTLAEPAPLGGVVVTLSVSNPSLASFDPISAVGSTNVTIPEGGTTASATIFTRNVTTIETVDVRGTLDNDFKETRLTINPWLSSLSIIPGVTRGGNDVTARVQLFQAPATDVQVSLSTSRPDLLTMPSPAVITVPAGSQTGQVVLPTAGVDAITQASIGVGLLGVAKSGLVTLEPAQLASLTFNPNTSNGGQLVTGTLRLDGRAGVARTITFSQGAGLPGMLVNGQALPTTVTMPAQAREVTFDVTAPVPTVSTSTTLNATDGTTSASGTLFLEQIDIESIDFVPSTDVSGGTEITGTVRLTSAAGPSGFSVTLSNSNTGAGNLSTTNLVFAPGAIISDPFRLTTNVVTSDQQTTITASRPGFTSRSQLITVRSFALSLSFSPATVIGGLQNTVGTLRLSRPASVGGFDVSLSSASSALSVPATVNVPEGATEVNFNATSAEVTANATANVTAQLTPAITASSVVSIVPINLDLVLPGTAKGGIDAVQGQITLPAPVPTGSSLVVSLDSSTTAAQVPATVTFAAGETVRTFDVNTSQVGLQTTATIRATTPAGNFDSAQLVLTPILVGVEITPAQVVGGFGATGTITIDVPAPTGGLTFTLSSNNAAATPVNAVTMPEGATSVNFAIGTVEVAANVTATISARTGAGAAGSATLLVLSPTNLALSLDPEVVVGSISSTATVSIDGVAPAGGHQVSVSSSDPSIASVPSTVTIPAGQTSTTFTITTFSVRDDVNVTISVSNQNSSADAFLLVLAPTPVQITFNPIEVRGGATAQGVVTLDAPAPVGGLVVDIFADTPTYATTPTATITIPAGARTGFFTVNTNKVSRRVGAEFAAVTAYGEGFGVLYIRP